MRTKPKRAATASGSSPVTARCTGRASHQLAIQISSPSPQRTAYGGVETGANASAQKISGPPASGRRTAPRASRVMGR